MDAPVDRPAEPEAVAAPLARCPSCDAPLAGKYCSACGELRSSDRRYGIGAALKEALDQLFHFDSKFFRTVSALLFRPGLLTLEYFAGRRKRYTGPFALFVVINLLFFLIQPHAHFFNWDYRMYAEGIADPPTFVDSPSLLRERLAESHESEDVFRARFDSVVRVEKKTLFGATIPCFATVLGCLFVRKRRYFVEHLVFSTHFVSFLLLYWGIGIAVVFGALELSLRWAPNFALSWKAKELVFGLLVALGTLPYLYVALCRVYRSSRWIAALQAIVVFTSIYFVVHIYRQLVFLATLHSV
jgi:hypothetical protein